MKKHSSARFKDGIKYGDDFAYVNMRRSRVVLDKHPLIGITCLSYAKIEHFEVINKAIKFGEENINILACNTDSYMFEAKNKPDAYIDYYREKTT